MSPVKSPEEFGSRNVGKRDKIVVEKDEAEELPPGWTKEVRMRKTGSATKVDRYYTDPVTGYIFHSLKDVQRYLRTGEVGRLATKPKIEEKEKPSELEEQMSETLTNKRAPAAYKCELPARASKRQAGINGDVALSSPPPSQAKTRQAIQMAGVKVDAPSLSRSLPESKATRLAEVAIDASPSPPEPKTRQATRLAGVAVDASVPSPPEPKTRQATRLAGVVIDVSPSLPEPKTRQATRLAEVAIDASRSNPEPKTRQATRPAEVPVDASPPSPLPPEPKTRQATRLAGVMVDASPSLPVPKTRQATRLAEVATDASLPSPSLPEPKTRQATRLAGVAVDESLPSASAPDTRSNHQARKQTGIKADELVPSPPPAVPKTRQAARQAGIEIDSLPQLPRDSKIPQATPLKGTEVGPSPPSQPEPKTRQAKRAAGFRDNASPSRPKTRRATQQAGIEIISPPPSLPDARTGRQAARTRQVRSTTLKENDKNTEAEKITDKHNGNADMDANTSHNQENSIITPPSNQESNEKQEPRNILPPVTPKEPNKQIVTGPTTSQLPEVQPPPMAVPPVNLDKQESSVVYPTMSNNPLPQDSYSYGSDMKSDSSINFSMNDLWTDPCIEFAVKTLTGAIPFTDVNKVENFTAPSEVPLEALWTDPCIEFAVKTLTGAIPVPEDNFLLHRPASSSNPQGPHNFSSPMNVCQTGHKNKQQDLVFPTFGNGGLQKS
ncbi:hypothetical protein M8C21_030955, partial [Ambrosia artemisiifolia]